MKKTPLLLSMILLSSCSMNTHHKRGPSSINFKNCFNLYSKFKENYNIFVNGIEIVDNFDHRSYLKERDHIKGLLKESKTTEALIEKLTKEYFETLEKKIAFIDAITEYDKYNLTSIEAQLLNKTLSRSKKKYLNNLFKKINRLDFSYGISPRQMEDIAYAQYMANRVDPQGISTLFSYFGLNAKELVYKKIILASLEGSLEENLQRHFHARNSLLERLDPVGKTKSVFKKTFVAMISLPALGLSKEMVRFNFTKEELELIAFEGIDKASDMILKKYKNRATAQLAINHAKNAIIAASSISMLYMAYQYSSGIESAINSKTLDKAQEITLKNYVDLLLEFYLVQEKPEGFDEVAYRNELLQKYKDYTINELDELIEDIKETRKNYSKDLFELKRAQKIKEAKEKTNQELMKKVDLRKKYLEIVRNQLVNKLSSVERENDNKSLTTFDLVDTIKEVTENLSTDVLIDYINGNEKDKKELEDIILKSLSNSTPDLLKDLDKNPIRS